MKTIKTRMEEIQIALYLVAISLGGFLGVAVPAWTVYFEQAITPAIAALIYTTFLQVPLISLRNALTNGRFLGALLTANFVVVPVLVWGLFQLVPSDEALQIGVLLVLLTPCIDYVIVFTHLGGGNSRLVLTATPILLLVQIIMLPLYFLFFLGSDATAYLRPEPLIEAFILLIALPLIFAWLTEIWSNRNMQGRRFTEAMSWGPVPLMMLVLFLVVGAEVPHVHDRLGDILGVVPVFVAYSISAPFIGWGVSRVFGLPPDASRALVFSASTRNSLVVLPLALAIPFGGGIVAVVVVTQTLVELLGELVYIRAVPRLISTIDRTTH